MNVLLPLSAPSNPWLTMLLLFSLVDDEGSRGERQKNHFGPRENNSESNCPLCKHDTKNNTTRYRLLAET